MSLFAGGHQYDTNVAEPHQSAMSELICGKSSRQQALCTLEKIDHVRTV